MEIELKKRKINEHLCGFSELDKETAFIPGIFFSTHFSHVILVKVFETLQFPVCQQMYTYTYMYCRNVFENCDCCCLFPLTSEVLEKAKSFRKPLSDISCILPPDLSDRKISKRVKSKLLLLCFL